MANLLRKIIPPVFISWYHFVWAFLGALLYRFPSQKLIVIGVTGTNGKSTTVEMISRILEEAKYNIASSSSIRFQIGEKEWRNTFKMTMPGRFFIQRFLRQATNAGCTHAVIEVTSEGILQHRHRFIRFHTAVFTNLSPEHIERHGSFEKYRAAKRELFKAAREVHVINGDDENAPYFLQFPAKKIILYSLSDAKDIRLNLQLLGEFNVSNALAAISVAKGFGISLDVCKRALENIKAVPGRMEVVMAEPFRVIVDYAFTPAALEKVYQTLKSKFQNPNSKLICVLGAAGGGRDRWKRPVLGRIAEQYCDSIIITNEDPYDEDPNQILSEIKSGILNSSPSGFYEILDRREAIAKALSLAHQGDTVVITGKGSEDSIAIAGGKKIPWDDRDVVREEMDKIKEKW